MNVFDGSEERMMENRDYTRREWLRVMVGTGVALTALTARADAMASASPTITVYKDPSCGCCKKWVTHLDANGFKTVAHDRADMDSLKDSLGVPASLRSCHTAVIGKLVIEGHVPAADIRKAIARPPKGVIGLAVPGMPAGSPGMEVGKRIDRYDVIAFGANGSTKVFATHG
jgi:hypothetical protein